MLQGWTPLHHAAMKGHAEVVWELLDKKASVGAKDNEGKSPLDFATEGSFRGG